MKKKSGPGETIKYAVLFADVVGSTGLYEQIGDQKAKECILRIQGVMTEVVHGFEGIVAETIGDEIMCLFPDPNSAVLAACEIQETLEAQPCFEDIHLNVRIGLHYGSVILEEGRVFGDTVNIAARMCTLSGPTQIITTKNTVALILDSPVFR